MAEEIENAETADEIQTDGTDNQPTAEPELDENGKPKETVEQPKPEEDLIDLPDGTKVSPKELISGYLRQSDYTKKTQEVAEERKTLREALEKINGGTAVKQPEAPTTEKPKYQPEQLNELKSVLNELGYVSKEDLSKREAEAQRKDADEKAKSIWATFFNSHPEYKQENDPGDIKYTALRQELSLYNTTVDNLNKILERAHASVSTTFSTDAEREKALALKLKGKTATVGSGGGQKQPESNKPRYTKEQIQVMQEMGLYDGEESID